MNTWRLHATIYTHKNENDNYDVSYDEYVLRAFGANIPPAKAGMAFLEGDRFDRSQVKLLRDSSMLRVR